MLILRPTNRNVRFRNEHIAARKARPIPGVKPPVACRVKVNGIFRKFVKPRMCAPVEVLANIESYFNVIFARRGELVTVDSGKVLYADTVQGLADLIRKTFDLQTPEVKAPTRHMGVTGVILPAIKAAEIDEPELEELDESEELDPTLTDEAPDEPEAYDPDGYITFARAVEYSGYTETYFKRLVRDRDVVSTYVTDGPYDAVMVEKESLAAFMVLKNRVPAFDLDEG